MHATLLAKSSAPLRMFGCTPFILTIALLTESTCEKADSVRIGMTEAQVVEMMGPPTQRIEDRGRFVEELPSDPTCAASVARILVYETDRKRRVRVGMDASGTVKCVVKTQDLMY